jgi:hypothetical protein
MKSALILLAAATGALGQVCGGTGFAVGVLELCTYESNQNEECSYTGTVWDTSCNTLAETDEGSNEAVICDAYNNGYGVTCNSGTSLVGSATDPSGVSYTCVEDSANENCGSELYGSANIQVCCTPS